MITSQPAITTTKIAILSAAAWLLMGSLSDLVVDTLPILFKFQQYLLMCAIFGLALGFFQHERPLKTSLFGLMAIENSWASWLCTMALMLVLICSSDCPGGLANTIGATLQDSSPMAFAPEFVKTGLFYDILTMALLTLLLFMWLQLFVGPGVRLKKTATNLECAGAATIALGAFAGGTLLAWALKAGLELFFIPPVVILVLACLLHVLFSTDKKICIVLSALAISGFTFTTFATADKSSPKRAYKKYYVTFWKNGTRVDSRPIFKGEKMLGMGVWLDRILFQVLPVGALQPAETRELQKQCGLPMYAMNYLQLPFRAMPPVTGKKVLVLSSGLGPDVGECLRQGAGQVTAVESQRWLSNLTRDFSFGPYNQSKVNLIAQDPRQYLRNSQEKFDLIIFTGRWAVTRPDPFIFINHNDYLLTEDAIKEAYALLNQSGQIMIISPAADDLMRVRLAANLISVAKSIDAELSTPYINYLIAGKYPEGLKEKSQLVNQLRQQLGARIVNFEKGLSEFARNLPPTSDNTPFLVEVAPMIPLEDTFFITVTMLTMLVSMRLHTAERMLQNITAAKISVLLAGATFMVLFCKACMILPFEFGNTPPVIFCAIIAGWLMLFLATFLNARRFYLPVGNLPIWLPALALILALAADYGFNYGLAYYAAEPLLRLSLTGVLPCVPPFMAAALLSKLIEVEANDDWPLLIGTALAGFALGSLLVLEAHFQGIPSLDILAGGLATLALLFSVLSKKIVSASAAAN